MTNREIAIQFLQHFCTGQIEELAALLAEDLVFRGPLYQFDNRAAYLACLRSDPPEPSGWKMLSATENDDSVCIFYEYQKSLGNITIAQLFRIQEQQIIEIQLVFDTSPFR